MADDWEYLGPAGDILPVIPPYYYLMRHRDTGEVRTVYVGMSQEIGDAIANGQWVDDDEDDENDEEDDGSRQADEEGRTDGEQESDRSQGGNHDVGGDGEDGGYESSGGYSGSGGGGGEAPSFLSCLALACFGLLLIIATLVRQCGFASAPPQSSVGRPAPSPASSGEAEAESGEPGIAIEQLDLLEGVDQNYQPLSPARALPINDRYGNPVRDGLGARFRYSGAVAGQTQLRVEIWRENGRFPVGSCIPDRRRWRQHAMGDWLAGAETGEFICAYQGPMLGEGAYRVQIVIDGQAHTSLAFQVIPRTGQQAGSSPAPNPVIGFAPSEEQLRRERATEVARQRYEEAQQAAQRRYEGTMRITSCFRSQSVCDEARKLRDAELEEARRQFEAARSARE